MEGYEFDAIQFFRAVEMSEARALLIGRRGRYALENLEKVDVLVARVVPTVDGVDVFFADVWTRRRSVELAPGVSGAVPSLDDLILTKRFGVRPKDLEDIRLLEVLRSEEANDSSEH